MMLQRSRRLCCGIQLDLFTKSELVGSTHNSSMVPLGSAGVAVIVSGIVALKSSNVKRVEVTRWRVEKQAR